MQKLLLTFAILFCASMAFGQTPQTGGLCSTGSTSCTVTKAVTAGQTVVLVPGTTNGYAGMVFTVSDSDGNTYTPCGGPVGSSATTEVFTAVAGVTNASEVFTFHFNENYATQSGAVEVFSGAYTCDKDATGTGTGTSMTTSSTATTTNASDLLIGGFIPGGSVACTVGGGWTSAQNGCSTSEPLLEYQVVSSTGAYSATASIASSNTWAGVIAALKPAPLTAAQPTFSPNGVGLGFTSPATTVTITSTTSGATDIYTTDGSTPGTSSGCTPSGTGTALTQSGTTGVTVNLSSVVTLKAIACLSGDVNSSVASAIFTLLPDQPILTPSEVSTELGTFFNPEFNIDTINSIPTQFRLDTPWTGETISSTQVSAWAGMGYGTGSAGDYAFPAVDYESGGFGIRGSGGFGEAVRTAETYPANQYASIYYHNDPSSGNNGVTVGTNGTAGSTLSGNALSVSGATSSNLQLYINGSLSTTITLAPAEGDQYEMRQYGTVCQPLKNGVQVTGLSATYPCAAATGKPYVGALGGNKSSSVIVDVAVYTANVVTVTLVALSNPFQRVGSQVTISGLSNAANTWLNGQTLTIATTNTTSFTASVSHATYSATADTGTASLVGSTLGLSNAVGYNISMGAVAATSPGVTPIAWGGNTYSNYAIGTITSSTTLPYPVWTVDGLSGSNGPTPGQICCNVGNALVGQYAVGSSGSSGGDIEQVHHFVPFQNVYWFHHLATVDATAWTNTNEFLKFASLPYNAPSAMSSSGVGSNCYDATSGYIGTEPQQQGAITCGASVEYCNTHKLHVTYANNLTASIVQGTANLTGTGVSSVTFTNPSCVSTSTATVYFWGGVGSGATATASMTTCAGGYQVSSVTVTGAGSYTTAPFVTIVPGSGSSQACNAIPNYQIRTAVGFNTAIMHGDEVLGVFNKSTAMLSVYVKGGSTIGGWTASSAVTPRVNSVTAGTTGSTIQASGLYQVAVQKTFQAFFAYPLNAYVFDGTNWEEVTTAGTSGGSAPAWPAVGSSITGGTATFKNQGTNPSSPRCTAIQEPCTGASQPSVWGGTTSTCEVTTTNGALTPDGTVLWQCVGEAAENDTAFQLLGTVSVPGFGTEQQFPGIWANSNSPGYGNWPFQDYEDGSGNPCTNGKYTCVGGAGQSWSVVWP